VARGWPLRYEGRHAMAVVRQTLALTGALRMISVVLAGSDDAKALANRLAELVPAAAEGLVREVAVLGGDASSLELAEDAGASVYAADAFADALGRSKGPWVASLPLRGRLSAGWMGIVSAHIEKVPAKPARLTFKPGWLGLAFGPEGWLAPKSLLSSAGPTQQDLERLARRSRRRLGVLLRG
jgi:hypothetical protein